MAMKAKALNITDGVAQLRQVVQNQFAVQRKVFALLNSFAAGDHMKEWPRVDYQSVIAQVYGDLAAHFTELKEAAEL